MQRYVIKRLIAALIVVVGVVSIVFVVARVFAPDPTYLLLGNRASGERAAAMSHALGLDQPIWKQYLIYMKQLFTGDLGRSLFSNRSLLFELSVRMPATIELAIVSIILSAFFGVILGVICAVKQNSLFDRVLQVSSLVGMSIPGFWMGLMLILAFSVKLKWLPVSGRFEFGRAPETVTGFLILDSIITRDWPALGDTLKHLILPAVSIAIGSIGSIMRYTRSTMLETIRQDYIRTARSKGLTEKVIILKHALRNALIPIVTIIGGRFAGLLGGSMLTETIFAWPGIGKYIVDGTTNNDYPVVQGGVMLVAIIATGMNLFIDLMYGVLDPRIRY